MTRDMIINSNEKSKDLFIVSIDQKKAFDNIDHSCLFNLLKHVNIGKNLFSSIHLLYTNSYSRLYINDVLSEEILIKRSIKQVCPSSMWLYIPCIEELLIRIYSNPRIQGYSYKCLEPETIKTKAYAEDTNLYLSNEESI